MAPVPIKSNKPGIIKSETDQKDSMKGRESNNLWVGNISRDVTESDLMKLFAQYGAIDNVTTYTARSYGFVYFKRAEDAKQAKDALQGTSLRGNQIKIEFARPAKPSRHLWVGGIGSSFSEEWLEEQFLKFGKIEDFKFRRDQNTAYVEYFKLEDASQAMKNMNGKKIGGDQLRVDFLRTQSSRREQLPDFLDSRQDQFSATHYGERRPQIPKSPGEWKDGQPSNILWIGYPPSVRIDEQMIHNAMILFGEIEKIKSFPSRHYSFVEFRSVDEARRAKEGLQGRLFSDPRITIMFSSSGLAPGKEDSGFYPGVEGPRLEMFNKHPFAPMDIIFDQPGGPRNFPGQFPPSGIHRPNLPVWPFGPQGVFDPILKGGERNDLAPSHSNRNPASGILSSPASGIRPPMRSVSSGWDVLDPSQFPRDAKRSRIDSAPSVDDDSFPARKMGDCDLGLDKAYGLGPRGAYPSFQGNNSPSPVGGRLKGHFDDNFIWRGIVAKGGMPVCHARCVPVGKGIESDIPPVINCSARTGLDVLAKHYAEAIGFDIVFFLPDSEDDFASYTEFLHYLGSKNRAGVAKFDDGTTLFLVPPSDFLKNVLKVAGPERLYGVVLKLPHRAPNNTSMQQQLPQPIHFSQYTNNQISPPEADYNLLHQQEEQVMSIHHNRVLHEDSKLPSKPIYPLTTVSHAVLPVPQEYASNHSAAPSSAGFLTPDLIATLSTLLPANKQSSSECNQPELASPIVMPPFSSVIPDKGTSSQGWKHDNQVSGNTSHLQFGNLLNYQVQVQSQFQPCPSVPSTYNHSTNVVPRNSQIQDSTVSLSLQSVTPSRPLTSFSMPSQSGQFALSPQVQGTNFSQTQSGIPPSVDRGNGELPSQVQQFQPALSVSGLGISEADKNQRYKSTLQFAANLLLQLQQQQNTSNPDAHGSGNQQ
ncbi:PREDICTED: flowering time control protein FPA-like [Populus euphratica]|uniref:Flowering time control protein FPA-like n=1 Tax=Populus euphratica TaxID=75702 RepID=A0AAJ6X6Q2_POPEU|nr:PREDICTED: flowering time control protein FPA-like [Populus euphratica]XP_011007414.1 PREDICTED: flowering time control protein FPA-like [Populus euphratica]